MFLLFFSKGRKFGGQKTKNTVHIIVVHLQPVSAYLKSDPCLLYVHVSFAPQSQHLQGVDCGLKEASGPGLFYMIGWLVAV